MKRLRINKGFLVVPFWTSIISSLFGILQTAPILADFPGDRSTQFQAVVIVLTILIVVWRLIIVYWKPNSFSIKADIALCILIATEQVYFCVLSIWKDNFYD